MKTPASEYRSTLTHFILHSLLLCVCSPNLRQHHGREAGLHEEAPGLGAGDEAVLGPDPGELLHVPHPLLGQDQPRVHAGADRSLGLGSETVTELLNSECGVPVLS